MSLEGHREYRDAADDSRRSGAFETAAIEYTSAAYEILGDAKRRSDHIIGFTDMVRAAICFRLGSNDVLCTNRCKQAQLILEDAGERIYDEDPLVGIVHELTGDCMLIGQYGDYRAEYEAAREVYEVYETASIDWQPEDEFQIGLAPFLHVSKAVGHEIEDYGKVVTTSLLARIDYKREHYPELLEALDEQGEWIWEDE